MTRRLTAPVLLWVLALAVLPQAVLCIGAGGHVAVEAVNALCCPRPEASGHSMQQPDCPPHCSDSPVGLSVAAHDPKSPAAQLPILATVDFGGFLAGLIAEAAPPSSPLSEAGSPLLPPRELRTTVHRC